MRSAAFSSRSWVTSRRTVARIEWSQRRPECRALQIESTPTGQKVRVFMEPNEETDGAWQRLAVQLPDGATVEIRGSDFYFVEVRRPDGSFLGWLSTDPDNQPDAVR